MAEQNVGKVVAIIGPVLDIEFPQGHLPAIYNAVHIQDDGKETGEPIDVIVEVAQQLGESVVRCVAMKPTDGMVRGMKAVDLGGPIAVPVGRETLGRILNVIGDPIDGLGPVKRQRARPIHREPPASRSRRPRSRCSRRASRSSICSSPKVNDRGPTSKNRIVDVSRAVAEQLDFVKQGTTTVEVEVVK